MYLGLWRFMGAALLGAMRFIELHTARARLLLAQCGQAKDMQDSYERLLSLSAAYVLKRDSATDITITQMFITLAIMLEVYWKVGHVICSFLIRLDVWG